MKTASSFRKIGLFAKHNSKSVLDTLEKLITFLTAQGVTLKIEQQSSLLLTKAILSLPTLQVVAKENLADACDLVIVVGGDGSLLNAARAIVQKEVPILGINRGRLGFLADILPQDMEKELTAILNGQYTYEKRFLLHAQVNRDKKIINNAMALNDVVLYSGNMARMIDFEVHINQRFVLREQADGLIAATPTGSTAYALSAGGPIVYPTLNAITLAPLCPHTLSSRPIVVDSSSHIELKVGSHNEINPKLSCDGQEHFDLLPGDVVSIAKGTTELTLIHPKDHDYFSVLRHKLGWSIHPLKD